MDETRVKLLHTTVVEFLQSCGYNDALSAYSEELERNGVTIDSDPPPVPGDEGFINAKDGLMQAFVNGNHKQFWTLWQEHIPEPAQLENNVQRLEFKINLYFAIFPMIAEDHRQSPVEASMQEFKNYLETKGADLSQTTEFVAYYALPYVPNPKNHPTFKLLFQDAWKEELIENLNLFLKNALQLDSAPYLYRLHARFDQQIQSEKMSQVNELAELKEKVKEKETNAAKTFQKFAKLQGDYHNLIGIAAELVDYLERCVRGQMITPEYLQDICRRLFGSTIDNRPGSAGSMLRASIQNDITVDSAHNIESKNTFSSLDYSKVKNDLGSKGLHRRKTLLLQALIWRLTQSQSESERNSAIQSYISNDILGCRNDNLTLNIVSKIFESGDEPLMEYLARFINVVASFAVGRQYVSQSETMIRKLVQVLVSQKEHSLLCENLLGGLQKLSLRRNVQSILIASSVIEWLLETLEEPDNLTDYSLEYTVALLMNLCLRVAGKKRCSQHPERMLKLLSDLLGFENPEIRQYVNGTLYSILALPSFQTVASAMCLEETLKGYLQDVSQDEHQLRYILKQLHSYEEGRTDDDIESDGDDDDDDDDEGDAIETECEKQESVCAAQDEESGEKLLCNHYTPFLLSKKTGAVKNKKERHMDDGPLTRPTTPRRELVKSTSSPSLRRHGPDSKLDNQAVDERPRTTSSKGSKQGAAPDSPAKTLTKKKQTNFKHAFTSRPKIPRSPDLQTNSPPPLVPPLTRSVSPPRPASGKR